jgi:hypothetical protein
MQVALHLASNIKLTVLREDCTLMTSHAIKPSRRGITGPQQNNAEFCIALFS